MVKPIDLQTKPGFFVLFETPRLVTTQKSLVVNIQTFDIFQIKILIQSVISC